MDPRADASVLKPFLRNLIATIGPSKVILFGSRARGDARPQSDFDLLVISEAFSGVRFNDRHVRVYRLLPRTVEFDVICLTPEEFERRSKTLSIIGEAAREGVELTA